LTMSELSTPEEGSPVKVVSFGDPDKGLTLCKGGSRIGE
jgi:hypothetical protein